MKNSSAWSELGLPAPRASEIRDVALRGLYEQFVGQLQIVEGGRVIVSDPYALSVDTDEISESMQDWYASLDQENRNKLLLLSIVCRPFEASSLWPNTGSRLVDDEDFRLLWADPSTASLAENLKGIPFGLSTLQDRRRAIAEPGLKRLIDRVPTRTPIETLSSEFMGEQPGNYAYQMWQVARWSDQWAVVYGVTDAAKAEGYPFPWLLGFCRLDDLERNFVQLLHEGWKRFDIGFYYTYGRVTGSWKLAKLALVSDDGNEGADWDAIDELLTLDDKRLGHVLAADRESGELLSQVTAIRDYADGTDRGELSLEQLLDQVGKRTSIRKLLERLEAED
jgi:hypothetical protein